VVPKLGHGIPGSGVLDEVYTWLREDRQRRQADRQRYPRLQIEPRETPGAEQQAEGLLQTAREELKQPQRIWRGVALLQGVLQRWPTSKTGAAARQQLQQIQQDDDLLQAIEKQGGADERRYLLAQARGLERFGLSNQAAEAWEMLAKYHPETPEGQQAKTALQHLRGAGQAKGGQPFLGFTVLSDTLAIGKVLPGGPGDKAGLKAGDVLVKINEAKIASLQDVARAVLQHSPGDRITIHILRAQQPRAVPLVLGQRPATEP
jgi:hypothetical protein